MQFDDDEQYPPKPRWIGWAIIVFMVLCALGVFNIGVRIMQPDPPPADAALATPEMQAARKLVDGSDCMRCHAIDRKAVGPGFVQVAERYASQADAQTYIADKIRNGSVGVWGNVIMPRHPQIAESEALQMAAWVMAHAPATASASDAAAPKTTNTP